MTDVRRPSKMSQQRLEDIRKEELTDISQIHLDENLSRSKKCIPFWNRSEILTVFCVGRHQCRFVLLKMGLSLGSFCRLIFAFEAG